MSGDRTCRTRYRQLSMLWLNSAKQYPCLSMIQSSLLRLPKSSFLLGLTWGTVLSRNKGPWAIRKTIHRCFQLLEMKYPSLLTMVLCKLLV